MFWKIVGGLFALFAVALLGLFALAAAGVAIAVPLVTAIAEDLDLQSIEIIDENGEQVTFDADSFSSFEVHGERGERVTVDGGSPGKIEVRGQDGETVTIDGRRSEIVISASAGEEERIVVVGGGGTTDWSDLPGIHLDRRGPVTIGGGHFFGGFFTLVRGMISLMGLTLIALGVWLLVRSGRPSEKKAEMV